MSSSNSTVATNCTLPDSPIVFDGDPDVAGIGVILAFMLSAWATYLFVLISFFFVESIDGHNNELDSRVVAWTRESRKHILFLLPPFLKLDRPRPFSRKAIENIAFTLSDQQLITGISILIVGFAKHPVITQYHFYIVYLLALLSYSTHQSTMMIVREELRKKRWKRWWRLAAIFLIFVFSFVANIPVFNWYFLWELGVPMQCVWNILPSLYTPEAIVLLTLTSIFLLWGFVAVARDIWPELGTFLEDKLAPVARFLYPVFRLFSPRVWHYWTRERLATAQENENQRFLALFWLLDWFTFFIFVVYFTILQVLDSRIVDLYRVWATLFYASYAVLAIRRQARTTLTAEGLPVLDGDEDTWGFGQILPMLLLALPVSQLYEMVWEDIEDRREEAQKDNTASSKSSKPSSPKGERIPMNDIPMNDIPSTASSYHAPPRQEAGEFYHIGLQGTHESVSAGQGTPETGANNVDDPPTYAGHENSAQPNHEDIERADPPKVSSASSSSTHSEFAVEKKLYESRLFWASIWVWIVAFFALTTYGAAVQGIFF